MPVCLPSTASMSRLSDGFSSRQVAQVTQALTHVRVHRRGGGSGGAPTGGRPASRRSRYSLANWWFLRIQIRCFVRIETQIVESMVAVGGPDDLVAGVRKHRRPGQRPGVAYAQGSRCDGSAPPPTGAVPALPRTPDVPLRCLGGCQQADPLQFLTYTGHIETQDIEHSGEQVSQLHLLGHPLSGGTVPDSARPGARE